MVIPSGRPLGICTVAVHDYWRKLVFAMMDYINQGRGTKVLIPNHHTDPITSVSISLPTQITISYADRQNLGYTKWDEPGDD